MECAAIDDYSDTKKCLKEMETATGLFCEICYRFHALHGVETKTSFCQSIM